MRTVRRLSLAFAVLFSVLLIDVSPGSYAESQLTLLGHTGGPTLSVVTQDAYAYVAMGHKLAIIDVSDPRRPVRLSALVMPAYDLAVQGDWVYVVSQTGLHIVDVAERGAPQIAGNLALSSAALGIAVDGEWAYIANERDGLRIVNVNDPHQPRLMRSIDTGMAWDVALGDSYAVVAGSYSGVTVVDVSDPANPRVLAHLDSAHRDLAVGVSGGYAYLAGDSAGLRIFDMANPPIRSKWRHCKDPAALRPGRGRGQGLRARRKRRRLGSGRVAAGAAADCGRPTDAGAEHGPGHRRRAALRHRRRRQPAHSRRVRTGPADRALLASVTWRCVGGYGARADGVPVGPLGR
ncbi:MAG: hypothetical protein R2856_36060 [Caldilineaceae bacterium]